MTGSLKIGEMINPNLVRAALEKMGMVLYFDGEQYQVLEAAENKDKLEVDVTNLELALNFFLTPWNATGRTEPTQGGW